MQKHFAMKDHQNEIALFNKRAMTSVVLILLLAIALIVRLAYLQIAQQNLYKTLSEQNQITLLPIGPNRGLIYDRNGVILAQNLPMFTLEIIPDKVSNLDATIRSLQPIIPISPEDIQRFKKNMRQHRRFEAIPIRFKLSDEEMARFYVNQFRFPGVLIEAQLMRYYPYGPAFVNAIGYVGRINTAELNQINTTNYADTHYIGKLGIEKHYEELLHGKVGYKEAEIDASGRIVRLLKNIPPIPGQNIYLSIDSQLQLAIAQALGTNRGAVVAINPNNGEILAMVSNPAYDPNDFVRGMTNTEYQSLRQDPGQPLNNRALRGQYALASTIKPYMALAGLYYGATTPEYSISDPGTFQLKNSAHIFRDWKKGGHGRVNLLTAITVSCDIYFFELALKLGITHMHDFLVRFGFGALTGIDVDEEVPGLIPSPTWKRARWGQSWYPGDTVNAGIGQGFMLATPLQLAHGVSVIANRGVNWQPHLLMKHQLPDGTLAEFTSVSLPKVDDITPETWDLVIQGMQNVIASPRGTAVYKFGKTPYTVAGKTGTAQLIKKGDDNDHNQHVASHLQDNSLFIAFAPVDQPKIAIGVVSENNHLAASIARQALDTYLLGVPPHEPSQPADATVATPTQDPAKSLPAGESLDTPAY